MAVRSLNKVMLIGNLTRDVEMRYTGNGTPVSTFGMATNKSWKDASGEVQESVQFHNIVAWNKMAEICSQLLSKGMKVYIEGEINNRSWEGDDGQTRYKTEIRVNDMILLDSKGKSGSAQPGDTPTSTDKVEEAPEGKKTKKKEEEPQDDPLGDEELPF